MNRQQFHVLYREFLFRMVDLEVLSAQGDIKQLLGQFGSILIYFGALMALGAMFFDPRHMTAAAAVASLWSTQHFLIATTMLVMGLFAVLSWDSTFPERRDVLVLAPLPVSPRTIFLAKAAALGAALGLTTAALNGLPGITWGLLCFAPAHSGLFGGVRALAAYWIAALAGAAFMFCAVLAAQGIAGQLPRRWYLRLSALLQISVFCLILGAYFLEPRLSNPQAFASPKNQHALAWLPSYWYLGLFHALNGDATPGAPAAAWRGVFGLLAAALGASTAYLLAYFRTLRKIVEEPDIVPGARGGVRLPRFGNSLDTAVVQFSIRTLLRSRQHRIILSFYLGIGFAILILLTRIGPGPQPHTAAPQAAIPLSVPRLLASVLLLAFWVTGTRAVFALPLELRANWIFRVVPIGGVPECLRAGRRALLTLSVVPLCALAAVVYFWLGPWRPVLEHLLALALLGVILCEVCLQNFQKVPFTCSYLPGKSRMHMAVMGVWPLLAFSAMGVAWEGRILDDAARYAAMIAVLAAVALLARWRAQHLAKSDESDVRFEEAMPPAVQTLGLTFEPTTRQ
jgi:hypothetical protein